MQSNTTKQRLEARETQAAIILAIASGYRTVSEMSQFIKSRSQISLRTHLQRLEGQKLIIKRCEITMILAKKMKPNEEKDSIRRKVEVDHYYLNVYESPRQMATVFLFMWDNGFDRIKEFMGTQWYEHISRVIIDSFWGYPPPKKKMKEFEDGTLVTVEPSMEHPQYSSEIEAHRSDNDFVHFLVEADRSFRKRKKEEMERMYDRLFEGENRKWAMIKLVWSFPDSAYKFYEKIADINDVEPEDNQEERYPNRDELYNSEISKIWNDKLFTDEEKKALIELARLPKVWHIYGNFFKQYFHADTDRNKFVEGLLSDLIDSAKLDNVLLPEDFFLPYLLGEIHVGP